MVRIVNTDSIGLKYTSPEATNFTLNKVILVFYATAEFFYCDTNAQCQKQDGTLYGTVTF